MKNVITHARVAVVFFMLLSVTPSILYSEELSEMPSHINTPQGLVDWLSHEFSYRMEFPDNWQSPGDTIKKRGGDCEDFATLASAFLRKIGVQNDIAIVSFEGLDIAHALCIWKGDNGSYSFISNRKLYRTGQATLEGAVDRYYPDWDKIVIANVKNQAIKVIRRK